MSDTQPTSGIPGCADLTAGNANKVVIPIMQACASALRFLNTTWKPNRPITSDSNHIRIQIKMENPWVVVDLPVKIFRLIRSLNTVPFWNC